jgi:hypothetical protein
MIENAVRGIGGIGMVGIFSICLFFAFFTGMAFWAVRLKKNYLEAMRDLPLESESTLENKSKTLPTKLP